MLEGCLLFSHGSKLYSSGKGNGESRSKDDMNLSACTEQGPFIHFTNKSLNFSVHIFCQSSVLSDLFFGTW